MKSKKVKTAKSKTVKKKKMDMEDLLAELEARFNVLEEKLDAVLSKSAGLSRMMSTERDPGFKTHATVNKTFPIPQDKKPDERKMYKAVCADCKQQCEVPFVPRPDRPVYCKTCYSNRRKEKNAANIPPREEIVAEIAKTLNIDIDRPAGIKPPKGKKAKPKKNRGKS